MVHIQFKSSLILSSRFVKSYISHESLRNYYIQNLPTDDRIGKTWNLLLLLLLNKQRNLERTLCIQISLTSPVKDIVNQAYIQRLHMHTNISKPVWLTEQYIWHYRLIWNRLAIYAVSKKVNKTSQNGDLICSPLFCPISFKVWKRREKNISIIVYTNNLFSIFSLYISVIYNLYFFYML